MTQLLVGTIQIMEVERCIETDYVLQQNDVEVLLHHHETTKELKENETVDVFIYHDKQMNLIATMFLPPIVRDVYNFAEVTDVVRGLGTFVNIGTAKEVLVSVDDLPFYEEVWPEKGDKLYVSLGTDRQGKLLALPATEEVIDSEREWAPENLLGTSVDGFIYLTGQEGSAMLTADRYRAFIHHTERTTEPRLGEYVEGRVIEVKEDGTINISLKPLKQHRIKTDADVILQALKRNNGVIPFSDKSDPIDIRSTYHMSKGDFKRALGKLMKQNLIEQHDGKTYLKSGE